MQDPTYPVQLATELRYPDSQKLGEVLKDCVDILVVEREGVKDYNNTRKRRIDNVVVNDLPKYATKIKKLLQHNMFDFWLKAPSFKLHFVEFHFDIDQLDLLSLLTLNSIDEAIFESGVGDSSGQNTLPSLNKALDYWETLQVRKGDWIENTRTSDVFLHLYRTVSRNKQKAAGRISAESNKVKAIADDLQIAYILLLLLSDESNDKKSWRSLNEFVEGVVNAINEGLRHVPLKAQKTDLDSVSVIRLKAVIKEINHFDKGILNSFVIKPIPDIKAENSRWRHYKIVKKWNEDFQFTYLDVEAKEI